MPPRHADAYGTPAPRDNAMSARSITCYTQRCEEAPRRDEASSPLLRRRATPCLLKRRAAVATLRAIEAPNLFFSGACCPPRQRYCHAIRDNENLNRCSPFH